MSQSTRQVLAALEILDRANAAASGDAQAKLRITDLRHQLLKRAVDAIALELADQVEPEL